MMNDKFKNHEDKIADLLNQTAENINPNPHFTEKLERDLTRLHTTRSKPAWFHFTRKQVFTTLAWTVSLVAFALFMNWAISTVAPVPTSVPAANDTSLPPATEKPAINNDSKGTPTGKTYDTSIGQFIMTMDMPAGAPQAVLYQLDSPQDIADFQVKTIRDLASRIGINGNLYEMNERYGGPGYIFTDGKQRIEVMGYGAYQFSYYTDYTTFSLIANQGNSLSPEEMSTKAEEFLKAHGLLDFPYQIQLPSADPNSRIVNFVPRLNDLPESYTFENLTSLQVSFDRNGEVAIVSVNTHPWQAVGSYPLISAQQAWDKFINNELNGLGVEMQSGGYMPTAVDSPFRVWKRNVPLNQPTSMTGIVVSSNAIDDETPLLVMDNVTLIGNLEGLMGLDETVQLNGQFIMAGDVKKFQVDSWQRSEPMPTLDGTLEQTDGQSWLISSDGQRLQMEDLPEDIQVDERIVVYGMVTDNKMDWETIYQGEGSGGGGGGGGGAGLARLNLSGTPMPTATPLPVPTPVDYSPLIGKRLEGERGDVDIWNLQAEDGTTRFSYRINNNSEAGFLASFWQAKLEGPATTGLETYYHLPVKIWGTITSISPQGIPTIQLERYEAVYPDVKIQVWYGKETPAQLEDKNVVLFTDDDGAVYAESDSLQYGGEPMPVEEGFIFYVVGWVDPEQTFGGHAVLNVINRGSAPKDFDFDGIVSESIIPPTVDEASANPMNESTTGLITQIELVYIGEDQLLSEVKEGRTLYAQPFWRFRGYYSKISFFDIIVQALPDEYLQPVPLQDIQ
ncbi:MAG: hypothetical protein IPP66_15355 [Anaerolineales bacterium]|nr:hypothetical protein [Anaerolineales bacterium]